MDAPALHTSDGYALSDDTSCALAATGDILTGIARLAPLADGGRPAMTQALQADSAALDAIDATCNGKLATLESVDKRGSTCPVNAVCGIGAFEGSAVAPESLRFTIGTLGLMVSTVTACVRLSINGAGEWDNPIFLPLVARR